MMNERADRLRHALLCAQTDLVILRSGHLYASSGTDSALGRIVRAMGEALDRDAELPYPWCPQPDECRGRGCCPKNPNCGD